MSITLFIPPPLRSECAGATELNVPGASVRDLLAELERRHPALYRNVCHETGSIRRHVNLFVNDDHIRDRQGLDTPLTAGDTVYILPSVSGG
ncbi:MAG TPA: MoaD family protein [Gemmatales bacterium]|nr:MoaD family protein [Gemmatales bacterium]HMP60410.1 MoaD family protein [Gemmatales bacterium]